MGLGRRKGHLEALLRPSLRQSRRIDAEVSAAAWKVEVVRVSWLILRSMKPKRRHEGSAGLKDPWCKKNRWNEIQPDIVGYLE